MANLWLQSTIRRKRHIRKSLRQTMKMLLTIIRHVQLLINGNALEKNCIRDIKFVWPAIDHVFTYDSDTQTPIKKMIFTKIEAEMNGQLVKENTNCRKVINSPQKHLDVFKDDLYNKWNWITSATWTENTVYSPRYIVIYVVRSMGLPTPGRIFKVFKLLYPLLSFTGR